MHYQLFLYWVIGIINWSNWVKKAYFQLLILDKEFNSIHFGKEINKCLKFLEPNSFWDFFETKTEEFLCLKF